MSVKNWVTRSAAIKWTADQSFQGGLSIELGPLGTGSWVNMPTTGPSGIGSGGVGVDAWLAYCSIANNWFAGSAVGDIAIRNTTGRILFGNSAAPFAVALSGGYLSVTYNAISATGVVNLGQADSRYQRSNLAVSSTATAGAITITAAQLAGGYFVDGGTQTAPFSVTTDTAANILAAMPNAAVGTAFKWRFINNDQGTGGATNVMTLVGGTGVAVDNTILPNPTLQKGQLGMYLFVFTDVTVGSEALTVYPVGAIANTVL